MTALQTLKTLKKEKWPELKTGEYKLPLIIAAMHKFAELRQTTCKTQVCACGNELTEKEQFYETCLKCGETV